MQRVWVCDAPFVSLLLQEVEEVFDSQGRAVRRDAEDGLEEVIQELLKGSLQKKKQKQGGSRVPGDEDYDGRGKYGDTGVGQQSPVLGGYLGRQQAGQVDLRQDLLAVTVPV